MKTGPLPPLKKTGCEQCLLTERGVSSLLPCLLHSSIEGVFYVDALLTWEKGAGTIGAAAQTLVTIQYTVFPPETFQADPSVPEYCK